MKVYRWSCCTSFFFVHSAAGAGLSGAKMAKRTGNVKEFVFEEIGENHGKGVSCGPFPLDSFPVLCFNHHNNLVDNLCLRKAHGSVNCKITSMHDVVPKVLYFPFHLHNKLPFSVACS